MLNPIQRPLFALLLFVASCNALANYKCTDSNGQKSYQEQPCRTGAKQQILILDPPPGQQTSSKNAVNISATSLVSLNKAEIFQEGPNPTSEFVSFTLRPEWINRNKTKVRVNYKVRFLDLKGTELYVDSRFKDIEASSSTIVPQVLATFYGKPSDSFKYKDVSSATIIFSVEREKEEKIVEKIRINRQ